MSRQLTLRSLCYLSAGSRQQTIDNSIQDVLQGIQDQLYVCSASWTLSSTYLPLVFIDTAGTNGYHSRYSIVISR